MVSREKDTHTTNRVVRVSDDLWEGFGEAVGSKGRAEVLREFMRWFRREPGVTMPKRPDPPPRPRS